MASVPFGNPVSSIPFQDNCDEGRITISLSATSLMPPPALFFVLSVMSPTTPHTGHDTNLVPPSSPPPHNPGPRGGTLQARSGSGRRTCTTGPSNCQPSPAGCRTASRSPATWASAPWRPPSYGCGALALGMGVWENNIVSPYATSDDSPLVMVKPYKHEE